MGCIKIWEAAEHLKTMRVLILLIFSMACYAGAVSHDEVHQLRVQLANLREKLNEAEHYPGQEGVDQVLYYEQQLQDVEKKLDLLGVSLEAQHENAPWDTRLDNDKIRDVQGPDRFQDQEQYYARQIAKLNQKLSLLSQQFDQPDSDQKMLNKKMHDLLQEKVLLEGKLQSFQQHPGKYWHESAKAEDMHTHETLQQNTDSSYVALIQEQLQVVYDQIFALKGASVKATKGSDIKKIGLQIAKLENEEKQVKQKLTSMGVKPEPPKVLTDPKRKDIKPLAPMDHFIESLKKHITYLDDKIKELAHKVKIAESGHEVVQLGEKMDHLQLERTLLAHDLNLQQTHARPPEKTKVPTGESGWGQNRKFVHPNDKNIKDTHMRSHDVLEKFDPQQHVTPPLWQPHVMRSVEHMEDVQKKRQRYGSTSNYQRSRAESIHNMLERKNDMKTGPQILPFDHWA